VITPQKICKKGGGAPGKIKGEKQGDADKCGAVVENDIRKKKKEQEKLEKETKKRRQRAS